MRSLSWRSILLAIAIIFLMVASIAWTITIVGWLTTDNPKFEPLNVLLSASIPSALSLITFLASRKASTEPIENTPLDVKRQNRKLLLDTVQINWVEGLLEKSLYAEARLELDIKEKPDALKNPWGIVLWQADQPNRPLPRGTKIIEVFDKMAAGKLLILGEPGGGKTTMLLELARDLIQRAKIDETQPIPVVFNLASWAAERKPIDEWLVDELNVRYQIPMKVGKEWVESDSLLLLLDGLDEVNLSYRNDCADTINRFRGAHTINLAVCSRIADYEVLTSKLLLQKAIALQPLTLEDVYTYLSGFEGKLNDLKQIILRQTWLQELVHDPLTLNIVILAYRNLPPGEKGLVFPITFPISFGGDIDTYRERLFTAYVKSMFQRPGRSKNETYSEEQTLHWISWLAQKMIENKQSVFHIEGIQPDWLHMKSKYLPYRVVIGVIYGIFFGLISGLWSTTGESFSIYLIVGIMVVGGLASSWIIGRPSNRIVLSDRLQLRWDRGITILGIGFGLFIGLQSNLVLGLEVGLIFVLIIHLTGRLASFEAANTRVSPNEGIYRSIRNSLLATGTVVLILGALGGLSTVPIAVAFALPVGFVNGGEAVTRHLILRLVLYLSGKIPWNYARFLDYCAERVFLRKVGGGYIFIHRLLLEYFAGLQEGEAEKTP